MLYSRHLPSLCPGDVPGLVAEKTALTEHFRNKPGNVPSFDPPRQLSERRSRFPQRANQNHPDGSGIFPGSAVYIREARRVVGSSRADADR